MTESELVVFGATSFVGEILTQYLYDRHGVGGGLKWAIAGRSRSKLEALRQRLGPAAAQLPMIVADAGDEAALRAMCAQTQAVVSTVGPYALYGSTLVKCCAEIGTDYCDLTGEVQWIAQMIRTHEPAARRSGARIVHCCGFDSIPSDLGTHYLQGEARKRFGVPCSRVKLRTKAFRGGMSGGTVASLMNAVRESARDAATRRLMLDPYAIAPGDGERPRQPAVRGVQYDAAAKCWVAPFVMAAINEKIVHRSNALSGAAYGEDFRYDEGSMMGAGAKGWLAATAMTAALGGFMVAAGIAPTRAVLARYVVPKPGEGPSPEQQLRGFFDLRLFGETSDGRTLAAKVTGDRDPGYGSTGKMLGEAAYYLVKDVSKTDREGGFWTPATLFGDGLRARLETHAGLTFSIVEN